jgi:hypothetical protein
VAERRELDAYDTPDPLAAAIVERVASVWNGPFPPPARILEPTAGGGAFVRACRARWPKALIGAVDINPGLAGAMTLPTIGADAGVAADIRDVPHDLIRTVNMIIGNPPYKASESILLHLLAALPPAVVMLLPVGFLASRARHSLEGIFNKYPLCYFAPIVPRPSFTADGKTDRMEYGVFGWGPALPDGIGPAVFWER